MDFKVCKKVSKTWFPYTTPVLPSSPVTKVLHWGEMMSQLILVGEVPSYHWRSLLG